jgi:poly(3-hydroxybutyrate) depolymerase
MSLNPDRHQDAATNLFQHLVKGDMEGVDAHRKFYDEYRAVMDVPGEYFLDSIYHSFQNFSLPRGELMWRNYPIQTDHITKTGLLTIEGELDDISCPGQTLAAHDLCSGLSKNRKSAYLQKGVGHYGIFNGRRWRSEIQPRIAAFIQKQEKLG